MDAAKQTAKTILIQKSIELIAKGDTAQRDGEIEEALETYNKALHAIEHLAIHKNKPNSNENKNEGMIKEEKIMENENNEALKIYKDLKAKIHSLKELEKRLPVVQKFEAIFTMQHTQVFKITMKSANPNDSIKTLLCEGKFQVLQTVQQQSKEQKQKPKPQTTKTVDADKVQEFNDDKPMDTSSSIVEEVVESNEENESDTLLSLVILKVDRFQFPLTKDVPCLAMRHGNYVFPTPEKGVFYGLVFPENVPKAYCLAFETLLEQNCTLRKLPEEQMEQKPPETKAVSTHLAEQPRTARAMHALAGGVDVGASKLAAGVVATGGWLASGVGKTGVSIRNRLIPKEEPVHIHPMVASSVKSVASVTPHLVFVSKTLVGALMDFAAETGKVVGSAIAERTNDGDSQKPPSATKTAAMDLGRSTVLGVVQIWESLEDAGAQLFTAVGDETVDTVAHKYGEEAADVAVDATKAAGDVLVTAKTVRGVYGKAGLKRLGKRAAVKVAKESTVSYFTYDDGDAQILSIEEGSKAKPLRLIEGVGGTDGDVFIDADDNDEQFVEHDDDDVTASTVVDQVGLVKVSPNQSSDNELESSEDEFVDASEAAFEH